MDTIFLDKYGLEWELMFPSAVQGLTYLGHPIVRVEEAEPSTFHYRTPQELRMPTPRAPPMSIPRPMTAPMPRPATSGPRVSFADPRMPATWTRMPRPAGSDTMHASSGHPAMRVPMRPPPYVSPLHAPLATTGLGPGSAMGLATRSRTRPSHLQKLVKKFGGTSDPYDHLASFRQVVRAEEVSDLHVLKEGFGLTLEGKALSWF